MNKPNGWDQVNAAESGSSGRLPAGGYVCRILDAVDTEIRGREYLVLSLDIAEGDFKDYWLGEWRRKKQYGDSDKPAWPCRYFQSVLTSQGTANPWFKGLITAVERSNPGYQWAFAEQSLKGKLLGAVFSEEEFKGTDGKVHTSVKATQIYSADRIRAGDFTVPEPRRLGPSAPAAAKGFVEADDELPF